MKPALLTASALLAGFSLGWLLKPAPPRPAPAPVVKSPDPAPAAPVTPEPPAPAPVEPLPTPPAAFPQAQNILPSDFADAANAQSKRRDEAKLARLVEALSLTPDQATALQKTLEDAREATENPADDGTYPGPAEIVASLKSSAEILEQATLAILTPDQQSAFAELRERIRTNREASKADREIAEIQDLVDLSAEQREQVRQRLAESSPSAPDSPQVDLILDSGPLPLGPSAVTEQGYETLLQLSTLPQSREPAATHLHLIEQQRKDLDQRLDRFKDILTPAQFERYRIEIAERRALLDLMAPPAP